ncbi:MAG: methyltransferase domain-containing protein [Actinoplanes sp.]
MTADVWESGDAYEAYVGRWSREVAREFVGRLEVPPGRRWLDVGCGTGALGATVLAAAAPATVTGVDRSAGFLRAAPGSPVRGDALALPFRDGAFDVVVSGLALNFVPRPAGAVVEWARVVAPGGLVAAYVWDYAEGMQMMRLFWDAAADVDPRAAGRDEAGRFAICRPAALRDAWAAAGLNNVATGRIEVPTVFAGFDDFWQPFLGGQGAAPAYLATLPAGHREAIRQLLHARVGEHTIALSAAAWSVRGFKEV